MHLTELRKRLLNSIAAILLSFFICWFFKDYILNILRQPIEPFLVNTKGGLIFTAPLERLLTHLRICFLVAVFISSPYWLREFWRFIAPGLYQNEKKTFILVWSLAILLFLAGVFFAYFIFFPLIFRTLLSFGDSVDQAFISLAHYFSFLIRSISIFAIVFEMPLLLIVLCHSKLISPEQLKKYRKVAIIGLAVLSAFITPPDIFSLFLLMIPLVLLYELSIWLAHFSIKIVHSKNF